MGGRGSMSGLSGGSTTVPATRVERLNASGEYQYHTTTATALPGIYQKGLQPNDGTFGKGVYLSETESASMEWAAETTGGTKQLRVKTAYFRDNTDYDIYDETQGMTTKKIPRKQIEVKQGGKWMTLDAFAKKYKTSFAMAGVTVK
jgi:hypothetical protein